jgi:D-alanine transaminase
MSESTMGKQVFLNEKLIPIEKAMVSVTDRGFMFGDGVYEVMPFYAHRGFRLEAHVERLLRSLAAVRIPSPYSQEQWLSHIIAFSQQHEESEQSIYVQVTRGPAAIRNHAFPAVMHPTVYMMSEPLTPPDNKGQHGVAAITATDFRWLRCDIKSISLLANVLLRQYALDCGVSEALLIRDGYLTEGAASNIFIVKNGMLYTPPINHLVLAGVTYEIVLELARTHHIPIGVRAICQEELFTADEVWLTSSTKEIVAITELDQKPIGQGKPGPVFTRMYELYQTFKQTVLYQGE